jgi:anti-sigma regulatory factor (Ser/Thr protein kinase)
MAKVQVRGEAVRRFILEQVEKHPTDISNITAEKFDITRQAVNKHLQKLISEGVLNQSGNTRSRLYQLTLLVDWHKSYSLAENLEEDRVWREDIAILISQASKNILDIWHYGFTEIFNNVIDHSEGDSVSIYLKKTAVTTEIEIYDNGIGIFKKIQMALDLIDERHAVLELAKGKLTTDPARHTGEGIFFASRMFDYFRILSGGVYFSHQFDDKEDWIMEREQFSSGTSVGMKLNNHTTRTTKKIFDEFSSGSDYGFTKTVVPVKLAQYGDEYLVSRSQAKRLLSRIDRFKTVLFDFRGVESIGQSFADEIFRVFAEQHPTMELLEIRANSAVKNMISRARSESKA